MEIVFEDSAKHEVWTALRELNDCWTKGDATRLIDYFHQDMVAITPTDRERRVGREACVTEWVEFAQMADISRWIELEPQIQIYGNTAVVTYYIDMEFETGGQRIQMGGRDMFVFVKEDGKWWAVADQFSPYPQPACPA